MCIISVFVDRKEQTLRCWDEKTNLMMTDKALQMAEKLYNGKSQQSTWHLVAVK